MNLKDQVCSLELAQKLKELGVKQESHFYYRFDNIEGFDGGLRVMCGHSSYTAEYSAFTVAELGEMLPQNFHCWKWKRERTLRQEGGEMVWNCFTDESTETAPGIVIIADTEANVRAKMLIYLLENNLLTI